MVETFVSKILKATHKAEWLAIVQSCVADPTLKEVLVDCFLNGDYRLQQCASNILNNFFDKYPAQLPLYADRIVGALQNPKVHPAVKRNVLRLMQSISLEILDEDVLGFLVATCFRYLQDTKEAIAVRAFSITVVEHAVLLYPELKNEFLPILEEIVVYGSSAEKNRASKVLKSLSR